MKLLILVLIFDLSLCMCYLWMFVFFGYFLVILVYVCYELKILIIDFFLMGLGDFEVVCKVYKWFI